MTGRRPSPLAPDPPTTRDQRRLRDARGRAHRLSEAVAAARATLLQQIFRQELRETIRSASPVLIALLALEGCSLDRAVRLIRPHAGWPRRPQRFTGGAGGPGNGRHHYRKYVAGMLGKNRAVTASGDACHRHIIDRREGGWLRIEVVGHSLEVSARIGSARFETRFGILRVELDDELPAAVAIACVGRRIDEVVDHEVLRGRGWIIEAVEDTSAPSVGQSFLVRTASVTCGVPSDERS